MIMRRRISTTQGLSPDEAASFWLVRLKNGQLDWREQFEYEQWLADSPGNGAALVRAEHAWDLFEIEIADGDPHLDALRESSLAVRPDRPRRQMWFGLGIGVVVLATMAFYLNLPEPSGGGSAVANVESSPTTAAATRPDRSEFTTVRGQRRTITLADGSVMTLNTDSAVSVTYTPGRRFVRLVRGQVLFEVAKDRHRPFVVQAADREVTALGTVFEVRVEPNRIKVVLVEGNVVVDALDDRQVNPRGIVPAVLRPGEELVATIGGPIRLSQVDIDKQLRWRDGFVEFNDESLTTAVAEINRYSQTQLVTKDGSTGLMRISGVFRLGNPERFAAIVGELLPVRSRTLPDGRIELGKIDAPKP